MEYRVPFSIFIYGANLVFSSMPQYFLRITFPLDYSDIFIYSANYCDIAMGGVWNVNIFLLPCNFSLITFIKYLYH